jgi:RHS repeat-associated protein
MQAQTSIRMPDIFMTPPVDCLLRAASAHPSISTGKERDTESGNDYFEARYYSRAMGRFMLPDWNAKVAPVPYAKLDNPQTLNLLSSRKGTKIVAIASGDGLPLAISVESASPAECRLVEAVLAGCFLDELPERLIGDKVYDSDALDEQLAKEYGIEMISPNRSNRKQKTQDGRPLRRYRRRWKVERLFAWMQIYRRLVTRWEYRIENFLEFVQLACLLMLLKHL